MPERKPDAHQRRNRRRSREITGEIAAVLREISAVSAVPLAERGDQWEARVSAVRARKDALIAEIEATAAARSVVAQDPRTPPKTPAAGTPGPGVVQ